MDRGLYLRATVVAASAVVAVLAVWPSLAAFVWVPPWIAEYFPGRVNPGLDIRGGLRLQYEVEVDEYLREQRDRRLDELFERLGVELHVLEGDETPSREQLGKVQERVRVERVGERRMRVLFTRRTDVD